MSSQLLHRRMLEYHAKLRGISYLAGEVRAAFELASHSWRVQALSKLLELGDVGSESLLDWDAIGCQNVPPDIKRTQCQPGAVHQGRTEDTRLEFFTTIQ